MENVIDPCQDAFLRDEPMEAAGGSAAGRAVPRAGQPQPAGRGAVARQQARLRPATADLQVST